MKCDMCNGTGKMLVYVDESGAAIMGSTAPMSDADFRWLQQQKAKDVPCDTCGGTGVMPPWLAKYYEYRNEDREGEMTNNRLYVVDGETGDRFCLAKSMGFGWYMRGVGPVAKLARFWDLAMGRPTTLEELFEQWADGRDLGASYGWPTARTRFYLEAETP